MALLPHPPELAADKFGDKFHHVLAFSVLSALATAAFPRTPPWRMIEHLSFLGAMIEVAQAIPALHRDCDIRDWVADTIAVVVVTGIARWVSRSRNP
jgi:VanZ family protein